MSANVRGYKELIAWQKAMDLVEEVYAATRNWPREEMYDLTSQVRRAAVSVPSNIAEGQGRVSTREFSHHLHFAYGSLVEMETQLLVAQRLGYLPPDHVDRILSVSGEVGRLINGLLRSLRPKLLTTDD